jgi:hypothetical protein
MYGLMNRGFEDLVLSIGGEPLWDEVRTRAGLTDLTVSAMRNYPDSLTDDLVLATAQVLGMSREQVLRALGRRWMQYTVRAGYGPLLALAGGTLPAFLRSLDALHSRIALSMPGSTPPSFTVFERDSGHFRLEYRSTRSGFAPLVIGLLEGLAELFGTPVSVVHTHNREDGTSCDEFLVDVQS